MDPEAAGFRPRLLRQRDLREHLPLPPPHAAQALEHRAVTEPGIREDLVQAFHRDGFRLARRPLGEHDTRRDRRGGGEVAGGVPGPGVAVVARGRGVHGDRTASAVLGRADHHLQTHPATLGQDQRSLQREVVQDRAADPLTGMQSQLHERGPRQQHRPEHSVIRQPRIRLQRQPTREQRNILTGQHHRSREQRVFSSAHTDAGDVDRLQRPLGPVVLVLEGVGGEVDLLGVGAGVVGRPVDGGAVGVEFGKSSDDGVGLGTVLAQGRDERGLGHAFLGHGGQNPARAQLQVGAHALGFQVPDAVGEPDRLADVVHPVVGGQQLLARRFTGEVGDDRDAGGVEGGRPQEGAELVEHGLHARRVECVAHPQPLRLLELVSDRQYFVLVAGDDDGVRAVEGGDGDVVGEQGQDVVLGRLDGDHRAAFGQGLHQPTAGGDERGRVLQRPDARDVRGSQLTDGVAQQVVRGDTPVLHQPEQGHLDGEQTGLRVHSPVQQVRLRVEDQLLHRPVQVPVEFRADRVERVREHRERLVQLPAHPRPLRPLAGEQERRTPAAPRGRARHRTGGDRLQALHEVLPAGAHHRRTPLEMRTGEGQRAGQVQRCKLRVLPDLGQQASRLVRQCLRRLRRQHPRHHGEDDLRLTGRLRLFLGHRLLEDHMGVGPAHAERGDGGPARALTRLRPLPRLRQQLHRTRRPVHLGRRAFHVERPGQHTVTHRHDHLDDPGDTRRRLGVADVGLQRTQPQRPPVLRAVLAVGRQQRLRLDRVTQRRARAVRLHHVHVGGRNTGVGQRLADHPLLRRPVRRRQAAAGAVLVDGRTPHHRQHPVTVAAGVRQTLDQQHAHALGPAGAVRVVRERLAAPVEGEPVLPAEVDEGAGRRHDGDAARQRHRALAVAQRLDGQVQGDQRRRARRVHRHRRPLQAQDVGDPAGEHAAGGAGAEVTLDAFGKGLHQRQVVVVHQAGEDTRAAALHRGRIDAGPLEDLPGRLQQQTLLRVHGEGLTR